MSAPWRTDAEAYAAFAASTKASQEARTAGSVEVETDEGFIDHIQFVAVNEWTYQDDYYMWPQLSSTQWTSYGLPIMRQDYTGIYGTLLHINQGDWKGAKGIYLRQDPDSSTHCVALAGPPSNGQLQLLHLPASHFHTKMPHPNKRGGILVSYEHARDILQAHSQYAS